MTTKLENKMKIVYCIAAVHNSGGMERVLANKANYLAAMGHDVIVITTDQAERSPFFHFDNRIRFFDLGINYFEEVDSKLLNKIIGYIGKQNKHRRRLEKLLTELKADIVVSMFDQDVSFLSKIKDGSKKLLEIHFSRFKKLQYNRRGVIGWIDKYRSNKELELAKRYDQFVVLTEEDRFYWKGVNNVKVIPNANSFETSEVSNMIEKRAIAIGRLDYQKGFDNLINIWSEVNKDNPKWRLDIFGDGPLENDLLNQISSLGLEDIVKIHSAVKNIETELLKSSMIVMTSRYEGFGMVLIEAQTCGVPLVAFACKCGPRDIIIDGENGFLIEEGDESMMIERINELINNPELRIEMGKKAKAMSSKFTMEKIMSEWMTLFDGLINRPL